MIMGMTLRAGSGFQPVQGHRCEMFHVFFSVFVLQHFWLPRGPGADKAHTHTHLSGHVSILDRLMFVYIPST